MKTKNKKQNLVPKNLSGAGIKAFTFNEVLKDLSKKKGFQKAYKEEVARVKLARQIKQIRESQQLTQQAVAKKAGMPQSVIARIESGEHSISVGTLGKVAHAFGKEVQIV